jgi:hypothetical protein
MSRSFKAALAFFPLAATSIVGPIAGASVAGEAACKREYVAKQAVGRAAGLNEADYLKACVARKTLADPKASEAGASRATRP